MIYLTSLGKDNSITMDILTNTYKQWSLAQQRKVLPSTRECTYLSPPPCLQFLILRASMAEAASAHFLSVFSNFGIL